MIRQSIRTERYKISLPFLKNFAGEHRKQVKYFSTQEKEFCISTWPITFDLLPKSPTVGTPKK